MNNLFGYPDFVVYLLRYSNEPIYKIGYTKDLTMRIQRIGISLPYPVRFVHRIYTDSPRWLEKYWHQRFAAKRRPGSGIRRPSEWFDLTDEDVSEFMSHDTLNKPVFQEPIQPILTEQNDTSLREVAIIRVVKYYNDLIRQHPHHAVKLANSCDYQINQINTELLRMQDNRISEQQSIERWEQRAYRAADKKVE